MEDHRARGMGALLVVDPPVLEPHELSFLSELVPIEIRLEARDEGLLISIPKGARKSTSFSADGDP